MRVRPGNTLGFAQAYPGIFRPGPPLVPSFNPVSESNPEEVVIEGSPQLIAQVSFTLPAEQTVTVFASTVYTRNGGNGSLGIEALVDGVPPPGTPPPVFSKDVFLPFTTGQTMQESLSFVVTLPAGDHFIGLYGFTEAFPTGSGTIPPGFATITVWP